MQEGMMLCGTPAILITGKARTEGVVVLYKGAITPYKETLLEVPQQEMFPELQQKDR